jgi:hypothetical protein
MQIIASTGVHVQQSLVDSAIEAIVQVIGLILPSFDRMTLTAWLIGSPASGATLINALAEASLYVALIGAASLFDLYRKSL